MQPVDRRVDDQHYDRLMLLRAVATVLLAGVALASCGHQGRQQPSEQGQPSTETVRGPTSAAPTKVRPVRTASCPYLHAGKVASTNGQHVGKVRVSAGKSHPACYFYRPDGSVQATVRPYRGDAGSAHALVDRAAPVGTSSKATDPKGWSGGEQPTSDGSVYAVAKGNAAVVVTTNQRQTIKARRIAESTISALHW